MIIFFYTPEHLRVQKKSYLYQGLFVCSQYNVFNTDLILSSIM